MKPEEIKELKLEKVKCENDFMFYVRCFFFEIFGNKFIKNFHHEIIAKELMAVSNGETLFLNINIPPRYTKTLLVAVMYISWCLAKNPRANFMYITGSDTLANETSTQVRKIVASEKYQLLFGVKLSVDQKSKKIWRTDKGGGMMCATIMGVITGFGAGRMVHPDEENYDFNGALIFDDLNKIQASIKNSAQNQTINEILFSTVIPSRLNGSDTPVINIQQRAGFDDSTSRLLKYYKNKKKVKSLVMPVIFNGNPLWEYKHDLDAIEEIKTDPETAYTFQSQYMQDPTPKEGLAFHESELNFFTLDEYNREDKDKTLSYIDTADAGDDDYSHPIADLNGNKIYIIDVVFNKHALSINKGKSILMIEKHGVQKTIVETNKEGNFYVDNLKVALKGHFFSGVFNTKNKNERILSFEEFIKKYVVFRSDYNLNSEYDYFMRCLTQYRRDGTSKHDDAPDSLAGLIRHLWDHYRSFFTKK